MGNFQKFSAEDISIMELPAFDPIDFKKFTDGKTIVKDTDMDPLVENEAKLHITNGIEKASGAAGVDIKAACKIVKEQMDRQYGHSFHVVMGEGFSFEVTRQANQSLYLYYSGK